MVVGVKESSKTFQLPPPSEEWREKVRRYWRFSRDSNEILCRNTVEREGQVQALVTDIRCRHTCVLRRWNMSNLGFVHWEYDYLRSCHIERRTRDKELVALPPWVENWKAFT